MAVPAVGVAAKVAVTVATDEKARKWVITAVLMLIAMFIVPVLLFSSVLKTAAELDYRSFVTPEEGVIDVGSLHELIGRLVAEDDTVYTEGPFSAPLHIPGYKSLITSGFGWRSDPFTGKLVFHSGLDFGCALGTYVYAVKPGKVIMAQRGSSGYGNFVVVSHGGGYASLYGHLDAISVSVGQAVDTDTAVGRSGNSGRSTAAHLHVEIIKDGRPQNPRWYLP